MLAWVPEHDKRQLKASAKVTDVTNSSKPELKSHQAARDIFAKSASDVSTSTSSTVKKKPTVTSSNPPTTTTISQSTTAKRKQPTSFLDVEEGDSHVLPKGLFFFSHFLELLYTYNHFYLSASNSKKSRVDVSDNEMEEDLPISMLCIFYVRFFLIIFLTYCRKAFKSCSKFRGAVGAASIRLQTLNLKHPPFHSKTM